MKQYEQEKEIFRHKPGLQEVFEGNCRNTLCNPSRPCLAFAADQEILPRVDHAPPNAITARVEKV
jgi:hypothetical protein